MRVANVNKIIQQCGSFGRRRNELVREGKRMDNILKIHYIKKHHPDVALFVQASPAFCCPSLVTEAMANEIERKTNTPVVSITYDGTGGNKNDVIIPYLKYPRRESRIDDDKPESRQQSMQFGRERG